MVHVAVPGFHVFQATYRSQGAGGNILKRFKNACLCQVEMSRLRAVCCLPVMTEAISELL